MNLNKVFIMGRVTAQPELRNTAGGTPVTSFGVATNRVWNDKIQGKKEEVEFHNIVLWGKQAEVATRFLTKGSIVFIEGRLQTRTWDDQQGQKRKTTEIIGDRLQLGPRPAGAGGYAPANNSSFQSSNRAPMAPHADSTDIPTIDIDDISMPDDVSQNISSTPPSIPGDIRPEDLPF